MSYKFEYTDDYKDAIKITIESKAFNIDDVLSDFLSLLRAVGFLHKGNLELVDDSIETFNSNNNDEAESILEDLSNTLIQKDQITIIKHSELYNRIIEWTKQQE